MTVSRFDPLPHLPFLSDASLVLGVLAIVLVATAWLHRRARWAGAALAAAGALLLYSLSVNIVDLFAAQAYGLGRADLPRVAELAKEAQVALSVIWTVVGVIVIAIGLLLQRSVLQKRNAAS